MRFWQLWQCITSRCKSSSSPFTVYCQLFDKENEGGENIFLLPCFEVNPPTNFSHLNTTSLIQLGSSSEELSRLSRVTCRRKQRLSAQSNMQSASICKYLHLSLVWQVLSRQPLSSHDNLLSLCLCASLSVLKRINSKAHSPLYSYMWHFQMTW